MGSNVEGRASSGERAGHLGVRCTRKWIGDWVGLPPFGLGIYSFEHGNTLPHEGGRGLLVEAGLY